MGSFISPVVANISMEYVEHQADTSFRESTKNMDALPRRHFLYHKQLDN